MHLQKLLATSIPIFAILLASGAVATTAPHSNAATNWYAGVRAGTLGLQGEVGHMFNSTFGLRFQGGGFFHKRETFNFGGVSYHDVEIKPQTYNLIADWYFLNNSGVKFSVGGGYNRNELILNRDMSSIAKVTLNGSTVPGAAIGVIRSTYHFKRFTPYVGIGYDSKGLYDSPFSLSVDVGAYMQGKCRATVTATGPIQNDPAGMAALKQAAQQLIDDTAWIKTYPVISVALRYNF